MQLNLKMLEQLLFKAVSQGQLVLMVAKTLVLVALLVQLLRLVFLLMTEQVVALLIIYRLHNRHQEQQLLVLVEIFLINQMIKH